MAALLVTFSAMASLIREFGILAKKPDTRAILFWMVVLLFVGTIFYHVAEGWSWLDSFYFCVITLSTVGYGDLDPSSPESKVFTIVYIFMGLSIFVSLVNMLAQARQDIRVQRSVKHHAADASSQDEAANDHISASTSEEDQS